VENSTLDTALVTFQFSHTLCGFWQTRSPAGKPSEGEKSGKKNQKEIKAMRCLKWKSKQKGVAKMGVWPLLTANHKVQIKIQ